MLTEFMIQQNISCENNQRKQRTGKGKSVPLQARGTQRVPGSLGSQIVVQCGIRNQLMSLSIIFISPL